VDKYPDGGADYYLAHVARIRAAAERATLPEIRSELFRIAVAFERLVEHAKHAVG
jgi:hypothetical protein